MMYLMICGRLARAFKSAYLAEPLRYSKVKWYSDNATVLHPFRDLLKTLDIFFVNTTLKITRSLNGVAKGLER